MMTRQNEVWTLRSAFGDVSLLPLLTRYLRQYTVQTTPNNVRGERRTKTTTVRRHVGADVVVSA